MTPMIRTVREIEASKFDNAVNDAILDLAESNCEVDSITFGFESGTDCYEIGWDVFCAFIIFHLREQ